MKHLCFFFFLFTALNGFSQGYNINDGTYLGTSSSDYINDIETDQNGNVFVCGWTNSLYFNLLPTGFSYGCGFVVKYNNDMTQMLSYKLLGGNTLTPAGQQYGNQYTGNTRALGLTIDNGNVIVVGQTGAADLATTTGAFKTTMDPTALQEAFVVKLDNNLNTVFSTFAAFYRLNEVIVSNNKIFTVGMANDNINSSMMTGLKQHWVKSPPPGPSATCNTFEGIVLRFDINGTTLDRGTYFGGDCLDEVHGIDSDADGDIYIAGETGVLDAALINTASPHDTYHGEIRDGFIAKLNSDLNTLHYSLYIGGSSVDKMYDIDVKNEFAYVCGETFSNDVVGLSGYKTTRTPGSRIPLVAQVNLTGTDFVFNTLITDRSCFTDGIAVDNCDNVTVVGRKFEAALGFPTVNPLVADHTDEDSYMVTLSSDGSSLVFSSLLGFRSDFSSATCIHFGDDQQYYIGGYDDEGTNPNVIPSTGHQPNPVGGGPTDAYALKLTSNLCNCGQFICPSNYLSFVPTDPNGQGECCYEIVMNANQTSCISKVRLFDMVNQTEIWVKDLCELYPTPCSGSGVSICGPIGDRVRIQYGSVSGGSFVEHDPTCYNELEFTSQSCPDCDCASFWNPGYENMGDYGLQSLGRVDGKCCYNYGVPIDPDPMACAVFAYDIVIDGEVYKPNGGDHTQESSTDFLASGGVNQFNLCYDDSDFDQNGQISVQIRYYDENGGLICEDHTFTIDRCPPDCCNQFQSYGYQVYSVTSEPFGCCWEIIYDLRPLYGESQGACDIVTYAFSDVGVAPTNWTTNGLPGGMAYGNLCADYMFGVATLHQELTVVMSNGDTCSIVINEQCEIDNCCQELQTNIDHYLNVDTDSCGSIFWDYTLQNLDQLPCNVAHYSIMSVNISPTDFSNISLIPVVPGFNYWTWQALNGTNVQFYPVECPPPATYYFAMYRIAFYDSNNALLCYVDKLDECCMGVTGKKDETPTEANDMTPNLQFQVYTAPNPANEFTNVHFTLLETSEVEMELMDITGKSSGVVFRGEVPAGKQQLPLDTRGYAAGTYLVKMMINDKMLVHKIQIE